MTPETERNLARAGLDILHCLSEEGDWRDLNSCADAIQDICLILNMHGLSPNMTLLLGDAEAELS